MQSLGLDSADGLPRELLEDAQAADPKATSDALPTDQQQKRLLQAVGDMTVVEKIKLARFGNTEARALLIRDRNRLVALAAVQSPKLTEKEVVGWAKARQLSDDVIRAIATTRAWTRLYVVRHALASNPRTPLKDALRFVQTLNDRDLKALMKSRDVPSPVNQTARKLVMRKGRG